VHDSYVESTLTTRDTVTYGKHNLSLADPKLVYSLPVTLSQDPLPGVTPKALVLWATQSSYQLLWTLMLGITQVPVSCLLTASNFLKLSVTLVDPGPPVMSLFMVPCALTCDSLLMGT
jgi:hypothetical protein